MRAKVLRYIRERTLVRAGDRVAVAVSGGADSVALLRLLLELRSELGVVLAVGHFNHGLRGEQSAADETFVSELAKQHGLEFFLGHGDVREHAFTSKLSIEAAGRELRYRWFGRLAQEHRFDCIATGHTCDDQAETVLLKFLRGAGTRGLAGVYPLLEPGHRARPRSGVSVRIIRPLLSVTRAEVEAYLTSLGQVWREDESNLDRRHLRNRIRHELLPLLEREYNPNFRRLLSDLADLSQAEEDYWDALVKQQLALHATSNQFRLDGFAELPVAVQRRVLKRFAETDGPALDFAQVEKLRCCALREPCHVELPGGRMAVHEKGCLSLCFPQQPSIQPYTHLLPVPGEIHIAELQTVLRAIIVPEEFARELPNADLLDRGLVGPSLLVRNWLPGDRFRPSHRRSEEKLKRLFAQERIPAEQRSSWPLALHENEIVWVQGLPVASAYEWKGQGDAVRIEVMRPVSG